MRTKDKVMIILTLIITIIGFLVTRNFIAVPIIIICISLLLDRIKIVSKVGLILGVIGILYFAYRYIMLVMEMI